MLARLAARRTGGTGPGGGPGPAPAPGRPDGGGGKGPGGRFGGGFRGRQARLGGLAACAGVACALTAWGRLAWGRLAPGGWGLGGEASWDPEEEWLLELNAGLPAEIDANTLRFKGVRDRMRREHGGKLPITFVSTEGARMGKEWGMAEMWADSADSAFKVRCVQTAFLVGVNCVPIDTVCGNRTYAKPHLLIFVKPRTGRLDGDRLKRCAAVGPRIVLAVDPVDEPNWCVRDYSLEGFHALITDSSLLARLETDGSVNQVRLGDGTRAWCKRKVAADRVFVIPHHHQMAVDLSRSRRRRAKDNFTVGLQGGDPFTHSRPRVGTADPEYPFRPASTDATRPVVFSEIKSRNMTAGNKGKVVFGSADMIATQRGWDMSISWNKACPGKDLLDSGSCQLTLACKSDQRFVNALALGVPAVGYAGYPSVLDACQGSELCLTTFEAAAAKRTVLDLAADDAKYRRYRESAARLSRAYHPYRIARRYAAMARSLLAHAEDVHRSPIVDTAECRALEDWAASGELGERGQFVPLGEYFRSRLAGAGGTAASPLQ